MDDYVKMAAAMRQQRMAQEQQRRASAMQGGAATDTTMGSAPMQGAQQTALSGQSVTPQQQQTESPVSQAMDGYNNYLKVKKMTAAAPAGSSLGATGSMYAGSGLAGTGYGLGGSLVAGGASGASAGSGLGAALGTYGSSAAGTGAASSFGTLGSTTSGGLGAMLGSGGAGSAATTSGAASGAASGAGSAAMGAGGMLAGLAALGYLGDKEMNESKGSMINADKINDMGTIGNSGIGLRGGDLVNGFNPAVWLSDPKKAGKGLVNAFTFGIFDGLM